MKTNEFYKSPQEGFLFCNSDETGTPFYYGYENMYGNWIIKQINDTTGVTRYAFGTGGYDAAWTGKAGQTYALPSVTFADFKE